MRILHVIPSYIPAYRYGGPVKAVHELAQALTRCGVDVSVFTTNLDWENKLDVPLAQEQDLEGVKVTYYPVSFLKAYCYSPGLAGALQRRVSDFDLVHIHSVFLYPTNIAAKWCQKKKIPYIINPFGALDPEMIKLKNAFIKNIYIRIIEQHNIKKAACLHLASVYEEKQFLALGIKAPVAIVPRGINLQDYVWKNQQADNFKEKYPQLKGKQIILFLGRIHFKKGLDLLAAAFKRVSLKAKDAYLVIAGPSEGGYAKKLKELFGRMGLIDNVLFTGMLLGEDKISAFYNSDIFVLASYGENFGISVLEAMACGLPVVITNHVGLYPDVLEYQAGIVSACDDQEIAGAILKLLASASLRKAMGKQGLSLAQDRFTLDRIAGKMNDLYEAIARK